MSLPFTHDMQKIPKKPVEKVKDHRPNWRRSEAHLIKYEISTDGCGDLKKSLTSAQRQRGRHYQLWSNHQELQGGSTPRRSSIPIYMNLHIKAGSLELPGALVQPPAALETDSCCLHWKFAQRWWM